jgi:hypothetical protein
MGSIDMAPCPSARLACCSDKHSLCFGLCVEAPGKFTAWYMAKDGEKLSEMLGIQLQYMLSLQKVIYFFLS